MQSLKLVITKYLQSIINQKILKKINLAYILTIRILFVILLMSIE